MDTGYKRFTINVKIPEYKMWFGNQKKQKLILGRSKNEGKTCLYFDNGNNLIDWATLNGAKSVLKKAIELWPEQARKMHIPKQAIQNSEIYIFDLEA